MLFDHGLQLGYLAAHDVCDFFEREAGFEDEGEVGGGGDGRVAVGFGVVRHGFGGVGDEFGGHEGGLVGLEVGGHDGSAGERVFDREWIFGGPHFFFFFFFFGLFVKRDYLLRVLLFDC